MAVLLDSQKGVHIVEASSANPLNSALTESLMLFLFPALSLLLVRVE